MPPQDNPTNQNQFGQQPPEDTSGQAPTTPAMPPAGGDVPASPAPNFGQDVPDDSPTAPSADNPVPPAPQPEAGLPPAGGPAPDDTNLPPANPGV